MGWERDGRGKLPLFSLPFSEKQHSLEIPMLPRLTKAPAGLYLPSGDTVLRRLYSGAADASLSALFRRPGLAVGSALN